MMPTQYTLLQLIALICLMTSALALPPQSLQPHQIALIINTENPDSRAVAEYYCQKRNVPVSHIISVPMPDAETISRRQYDENIAPVLRDRLNRPDFKDRIKCLLTIRGVPLRINNFVPTGELAVRRDLIVALLDQSFDQIVKMTGEFQTIAGHTPAKPLPDEALKLPRDLSNLQNRTNSLLQEASAAGETARKAVEALPVNDPERSPKLLRLYELNLKWDGLQGRYNHLSTVVKNINDAKEIQIAQKQLREMQNQRTSLNEKIQKLTSESASLEDHKERYQLIFEGVGISTLCRLLVSDRIRIDDLSSYAAFDSELSLILWEPYSLTNWQLNHLRSWRSNLDKMFPDDTPAAQKQPIMMVARLDGPTLEIAQGLIDKALTAEKAPLSGTAYIDARGLKKANPDFGSYEFTDESLRQAAQYLRENTGLKVVLDDNEALFPPNSCPDTTLYCGWYSVRNYIDSFTFNPGAVGFHIASFEAQTLRRGDPDSNIWCKRLLEKGITATLGPVNEPYLLSFPLADQFFADLVGGQYCLVECFYRTKPFNSWQLTLIGDPLYRPKFKQ